MTVPLVIAFNNVLKDLLQTLCNKFPGDKEVLYTKTQVEIASSCHSKLPAMQFTINVKPFIQHIQQKNETFFLRLVESPEYKDLLQGLDLSEKYTRLNQIEKEQLWQYFQKLVILGQKIFPDL